ncbi:hypothetical protein KI387_039341, partial [Taxus chinensis]
IMAKDKYGGHTPKVESTISMGRKQLLDITNTGVPLASSLKDTFGDALSTPLSKGSTAHLLKEVGLLKKLLAEKEELVESQALEMKKIWVNWCRQSQQNRQLIKKNSEISKELAFDREKLRLVQHDYKQMSAMFKAKIAELEGKCNDLSQLLQGAEERKNKNSCKAQNEKGLESKLTFCGEKDSSPCTSGNMSNGADGSSKLDESANGENSSERRTCLRRRSAKISYKEPSINKKLRQNDQIEWLAQTSSESNCHGASCDGLDNLEKVCEDEVLHFTDVPQLDPMIQDHPSSGELQYLPQPTESCQSLENACFPYMKMSAFSGKATRVEIKHHEQEEQEACAPTISSLNAALESTQQSRRSLAGRPMRKAAEIVVSYKEIPLKVKMRRPA